MRYPGLISGKQKNVGLQTATWDYGNIVDDKLVIDPMLHFGCFVLGYKRFDIIDYVCDRMKIKPEVAETFFDDNPLRLNHPTWKLGKTLKAITGYKSIFSLSGSDAVEGAVKLASAYQAQIGQHERKGIVTFRGSYHGSTLLTQSMGDGLFNDPFYTMKPYDSILRLSRDFFVDHYNWDNVMCVVVESCPYSNGLQPHTERFWYNISQIQERGVIIIVDDIFTGGGKTGNFMGWKKLPVTPDICTMGKAITGGYFPLSMVLYSDKVDQVLPRNFEWEHGFTYSYSLPGILSCLKYIDILAEDGLMKSHRDVVVRAVDLFNKMGYTIKAQYGTIFEIQREHRKLYTIPINATDEYYAVLEDELK